jgi:ferredoxin
VGPYSGAGAAAESERTILEIEVVPELCLSFMNCMRIATGAFETDHERQRTRPTKRWRQVAPAKLWRAGWSCPSGAIRFVTDQGYVTPRWEEAARWSSQRHPAAGVKRESVESGE